MHTSPALTVVLATPDTYESIRLTMQYLRAQTARPHIEVVIVCPCARELIRSQSEFSGFWGHQLVEVGAFASVARANAAGVRHARAPVVALAEDHCFPEPEWGEALIAAHQGPWSVVGPAMRNANPRTMVSWCDFVIGYGPWMYPVSDGPVPFLPGHNSCYKTRVLVEYGDGLEEMMEAETVLHLDLRRRGHCLYLEPAARVAHTNFGFVTSWLPVQFYAGRVFGASRARQWKASKRIFYFAASPLIPAVRLWRCLFELAKPGRPWRLIPRVLPLLVLGLVCDGAGQMAGYLFGAGNAVERVAGYEFHRFRHVPGADCRDAEKSAPA